MSEILLIIEITAKILLTIIGLVIGVICLVFAERKVIAYMQGRLGPNRVGPSGLLQVIVDIIKLLTKEIIIPAPSNRYLFFLAPLLTVTPALAVWAAVPFSQNMVLANINAGVLYLFAMSSLGIYGIVIAGWSPNSKYALLGSLRGAAQMISYEIPLGFALVGVLLAAGSANLQDIVLKQQGGFWHWYWLPLLPLFVVFWISSMAETNRTPFDVVEGEAEIVGGFHVEYSGITFSLFFLAEYINMIFVSVISSLFFLGGWLSPFQGIPVIDQFFLWVPGIVWLLLKASIFLYLYLWIRATLPRYRYDQIMGLAWKVLIPVTLIWITVVAVGVTCQLRPWFN